MDKSGSAGRAFLLPVFQLQETLELVISARVKSSTDNARRKEKRLFLDTNYREQKGG